MQLGEIIGKGKYRDCYSVQGSHLCAKKKRPFRYRRKDFTPNIFKDLNKEELQVYQSLPKELKVYFPENYQIQGAMLLCDRPRDYDGAYSRIIMEHGPISNLHFWRHIDIIFHILMERKIWLFDIFNKGNNIMVQKVSEDILRPVIIDCKKFGFKAYPFQINLWWESERKKKLIRRMGYFKSRFQDHEPSLKTTIPPNP